MFIMFYFFFFTIYTCIKNTYKKTLFDFSLQFNEDRSSQRKDRTFLQKIWNHYFKIPIISTINAYNFLIQKVLQIKFRPKTPLSLNINWVMLFAHPK
jgi:hypothetical protein